ncbi:molybdopterin molybdotransferase MoeA [Plantibacter sp. CFBP 13570]|uniref:molybdopterin molybdotransferase MoeA n=1 Tax=Plantibacter sp. CFBP 13570 TaxID=2775272 RepID=UPI0019308D6B|nr:molybdopterin molybdotransferase MoeA [Plantibacter sp. CFBP 13570]MBD8536577.1 molybdopterin molybdotransferase MoeA [Plantibacter sp. CFBP 13570]
MTRSSWSDARSIAHAAGAALRSDVADTLALTEALGHVLAAPLVSPIAIPHYDSSAMDGWALAGSGPWVLLTGGDAERARSVGLSDGVAVDVLTGGLIPAGAEAVLQLEHGVVEQSAGSARLHLAPSAPSEEPRPGRHIRPAGTESPAGATLLDAGTRLGPVHLAVAAGAGFDRVPVVPTPRVRLVLTGDEVVTSGVPGPGFVRDSFGPSLPGVITSLGGVVTSSVRVGDDASTTADALGLTSAVGAPARHQRDLVVTTGGTGDSRADHVRALLRDAGADFLVDGVDVRPGGPALLARLPDGRLFVGLPGNPLAALLSVLTLVHPVLAGLQGLELPALRPAVLASPIDGVRSGTVLRPYRSVREPDSAMPHAEPTPWHGAAMLRGLADADGVLVCPGSGAATGGLVPSLDLPW